MTEIKDPTVVPQPDSVAKKQGGFLVSTKNNNTNPAAVWGCSIVYGMSSALIGQPFDTVKTKMQAEPRYRAGGMGQTFLTVIRKEGFFALYKGLVPPLISSTIFRSVQFTVYSWAYNLIGDNLPASKSEIPFTFGLQPRVILAGIFASTMRAVVENPLEYIKVRKQVNQPWKVREMTRGFLATWIRASGLMVTFFILADSGVRLFPQWFNNQPYLGPFLQGGLCATLSWWLIWPFEVVKSQIQGQSGVQRGIWERLKLIKKENGTRGLFRGLVPGSCRSMLANGLSMILMANCMKFVQNVN